MCIRCHVVIFAVLLTILAPRASADLSLETETARLIKPGHYELSLAAEYQSSPQGEEQDLPLAFEYGIMDRLEILVEPVPFTRIRPKGGPVAQGLGDTEITLTYLLLNEQKYTPALAAAFEVKIPTARNLQIGSRVADYRIYLAASKALGDFDFHANVGYNIIGAPSSVNTKNPIDLEFAVEWFIHPKVDLFAEINYVDSSRGSSKSASGSESSANAVRAGRVRALAETTDGGISSGPRTGGATTAEIFGTEIIGTLGARYHLKSDVDVYGSVSYDNNNAVLYRLGITYKH